MSGDSGELVADQLDGGYDDDGFGGSLVGLRFVTEIDKCPSLMIGVCFAWNYFERFSGFWFFCRLQPLRI